MATEFILTLADPAQVPGLFKNGFLYGHSEPRIAFVGRSNVGKSSLINAVTRSKIARVSATPGKTRAIHFFKWLEAKLIITDLPGYGFAKVAKTDMKDWAILIDAYFKGDDGLATVFMLFDSRHGPTDLDLGTLEYFAKKGIPLQIVMTKVDQLKNQSEKARRKKEVLAALIPYGIDPERIFWVSTKEPRTLEFLRSKFI